MKFRSFSDLPRLLPGSKDHVRASSPTWHDGEKKTVHISLETKGRKGKTVTLISGLQHNADTMKEIARTLKGLCGTGGTVKDGSIELQGDQRLRASAEFRKMNYTVKG